MPLVSVNPLLDGLTRQRHNLGTHLECCEVLSDLLDVKSNLQQQAKDKAGCNGTSALQNGTCPQDCMWESSLKGYTRMLDKTLDI